MPYERKKKRLEKKTEVVDYISSTKFFCCRCGTAYSRRKGFFPVSHSPMYRGSGYLSMCNECVEDLYENYRKKLGGDREALKRMCMKLDLYWNESIYKMVERTSGVDSRVRKYICKTNMNRYIDKTYDNTIEEEEKALARLSDNTDIAANELSGEQNISETSQPEPVKEEKEEIIVSEDVLSFWGPGIEPELYSLLDERYQYWVSELPKGVILDVGTKALLRQIVNAELEVNRLRDKGEAIDKAQKTLNDLLGSALLRPTQQKDSADAELENMPLGVGIEKWERLRPLPATPENQKDKNGWIKKITTWYLGHAAKMVGLRNGYSKLYEDEMNKLRAERPEYSEEDDDTLLNDIFGSSDGESDGS